MKLDTKVTLIFKNKEGDKQELTITVKQMLEKTVDDFHEYLEDECSSGSCYTETQNFCDCGGLYGDYEIDEVVFYN